MDLVSGIFRFQAFEPEELGAPLDRFTGGSIVHPEGDGVQVFNRGNTVGGVNLHGVVEFDDREVHLDGGFVVNQIDI